MKTLGRCRSFKMLVASVAVATGASLGACSRSDPVRVSGAENAGEVELASHQELQATLQTIGPGEYGDPALTSDAVRFVGMSFSKVQTPGGPTQIYTFTAEHAGTSTITIPHRGDVAGAGATTFTLSVTVQ